MGNSSKRLNKNQDDDLVNYHDKHHSFQDNSNGNQFNNKFPFYNDLNYFDAANEPTPIATYLYLGGSFGNRNPSMLKQMGITHVLNMAVELQPHYELVNNKRHFKHKHIMADDTVHYNLRYHFEEAFHFIDDAVQMNSKVLVHCMMGISRSATIVIAYLMSRHKMSLNSAYMLVKKKRPIIAPNPTFMRILEQFEYELYHNYAKMQQKPHPQQMKGQNQNQLYGNPKIYSKSKQISGNTSSSHNINNYKTSSNSNINNSVDSFKKNMKQKSLKFIESGNKVPMFSLDDLYDKKRIIDRSTPTTPSIPIKKNTLAKQKKAANPLNPYILPDIN